jgi:hypothetical protein
MIRSIDRSQPFSAIAPWFPEALQQGWFSAFIFGVIGFLWMIGPQPGSHDWLWIDKGHLSDSHISTGLAHALP